MEKVFFILLIIFSLYGFFILWITLGCFKIKTFIPKVKTPENTFTIVVPFRNEKENIPVLLDSFSNLNYPKELFEVILVDDQELGDGEEETVSFLTFNFPLSIIRNERKSNSPKKDAINTAIQKAKFDWIITTDADCIVSEKWLSVLDGFIQENQKSKMVCGIVFTKSQKGFLNAFQALDFISLQSATIGTFGIGKPFMCNGANFAYRKDFFEELNGFSGNENIASGDDVFLLQKAIKKNSNNVFYLRSKEFTVLTNPVLNWKELFFQRVRWASKTKAYKSSFAKTLAVVVLLGNLGFLLSVLGLFWNWNLVWFVEFKLTVDFILLIQSRKANLMNFLVSGFVYSIFSFCVGTYILFNRSYSWKGRNHNT